MDEELDIAEAWRIEALRRLAELDSGAVDTISVEEAQREVCKLLGRGECSALKQKQTRAKNVAEIFEA